MSSQGTRTVTIHILIAILLLIFPALLSAEGGYNYLRKWGSGLSDNQFRNPMAVAADVGGNIYVVDTGNHRIQKFSSAGGFIASWGSAGTGTGQFLFPSAIATDLSSNVYVADTFNNRVQAFTSSGAYATQFGQGLLILPRGITSTGLGYVYVTNQGAFAVRGCNTSGFCDYAFGTKGSGAGQFDGPQGIAISAGSNLYIVDSGNNRIQTNAPIPIVWGSLGSTDGLFNEPVGIAVDGTGVYVADSDNHRIQKFNLSGDFQSKWPLSTARGQLDYPSGLAIDATGELLVADTGNNRIQRCDANLASCAVVVGSGYNGPGQFNYPSGVALDASNNVYVVDSDNYRIQKFSSDGTFLAQWGSRGSTDGQFDRPKGIAVSSNGVYVVDSGNNRIQRFTLSGGFVSKSGSAGSGNGNFQRPAGIALDSVGNVYVVDSGNNRVKKFDASLTFLSAWGQEFLAAPQGIAIDSSNRVYVADFNNSRIQVFSTDGAHLTQWGSAGSENGQFLMPFGVAVDAAGNVYVADSDNHRIQKFTNGGLFVTKWGSTGTGNGQLVFPAGLAIDSGGNVYVADTGNHRIQVFAPQSQTPSGGGGGGCFIATAAFGSYLHPKVAILRNFRDRFLLTNAPGTWFVHVYYRHSPPLAEFVASHETARTITRWVLAPLIYGVQYPLVFFSILIFGIAAPVVARKTSMGRK